MKRISIIFCLFLCTGMKEKINVENSSSQEELLVILKAINTNNEQFLSAHTFENDITQEFQKYSSLNQKRTEELQEESYNALTIPALIMLNDRISKEYIKVLNQDTYTYHSQHMTQLEKLKTLLHN